MNIISVYNEHFIIFQILHSTFGSEIDEALLKLKLENLIDKENLHKSRNKGEKIFLRPSFCKLYGISF